MPLPTLLRPGFLKTKDEKAANMRPVDYIIGKLQDALKKPAKSIGERVLVVKASTGSGKSTVMIQSLYTAFCDQIKKNIAVTQPRVITAVDIAMGMPEHEPLLKLDKNVGYVTGPYKRPPKERGIIYMTIDVLVQQFLMNDGRTMKKKYGFIVIDEVHERKLSLDNCLFMIKRMLKDHYDSDDCPFVILTSATFDERMIMNYFEVPKGNYIEVEGFAYEKTKIYPKNSLINYRKYIVAQVTKVHLLGSNDYSERERDILIFLSTGAEIKEMAAQFHKKNTEIHSAAIDIAALDADIAASYKGGKGEKYYMLPIQLTRTSYQSGTDDYHSIFAAINTLKVPIFGAAGEIITYVTPSRRVFISTNIAETGLTLNTLKYCFDSGFYNAIEFSPSFGCSVAIIKPISQGMSIQRMGRVGRLAPGVWYPAYTKSTFDSMQVEQFSEINLIDIAPNLITIMIEDQEVMEEEVDNGYRKNYIQNPRKFTLHQTKKIDFKNLDVLEPPSAESLLYALEKLNTLGFIDINMRVTEFGFYANKMRFINMESIRMIFSGYAHGVSIRWLITMAAIVFHGSLYVSRAPPLNYMSMDDKKFETYHNLFVADDFILQLCTLELAMNHLLLQLTKSYEKNKNPKFNLQEWCESNGIKYDIFLNVIELRDELFMNFVDCGLNPYAHDVEPLIDIFRRDFDEAMGEVKLIKKCIYEGFRMKLLVWDEKITGYVVNNRRIPITVSSPYTIRREHAQPQPNYIIAADYALGTNRKNIVKMQAKGWISVLDGHVEP